MYGENWAAICRHSQRVNLIDLERKRIHMAQHYQTDIWAIGLYDTRISRCCFVIQQRRTRYCILFIAAADLSRTVTVAAEAGFDLSYARAWPWPSYASVGNCSPRELCRFDYKNRGDVRAFRLSNNRFVRNSLRNVEKNVCTEVRTSY